MMRALATAIDSGDAAGLFVDATARVTMLLLVAWWGAVMLRRRSAALRHSLWAMALCGAIVMPVVSRLAPGWRLPVLPAAAVEERRPTALAGAVPAPMPATPDGAMPRTFIPAAPGRSTDRSRPARPAPPRPVAAPRRAEPIEATPLPLRDAVASWSIPGGWLAAWGLGALAAGLPTLLGLLSNRRVRRRSRPVVDADWLALAESLRQGLEIGRPVELLQCEGSAIPMTWGILRPVILLPEGASDWPEQKRRLVLLHELAHIRRHDAAIQLVGRLAAILYWFHPLAWFALHRLRVERERACDDCVVLAGERPTVYASQLLELALSARAPRLSAAIAMARTNLLEDRLKAMFDETRSHGPLDPRSGRRLTVAVVALVIGLAMIHPRPSSARVGTPAGAGYASPVTEATAPVVEEPPAKGTGRIAGRVTRGGEAVGGAEVVLLAPPPKGQTMYIGKLPLRHVAADAGGAFAFDGLPPGRYRVWANHEKMTSRPRHARGEVVIVPESGAAPGPVELRLAPAATVAVRVVDKASGQPIAGATVRPSWSDFVDDFTTDRDGRVRVGPLTGERWRLEALADGFAKQLRWLNLENGADAEAEFRLELGGDLEGVVRDPDGKPVAGVGLSVVPEGAFEQFEYDESDAQGRYRLRNLPADIVLHVNFYKTGRFRRDTMATRVTGPRQTLDVALERRPHGGSIEGSVRDPQGHPIAGAVLHNPSNSSSEFREAKTGPDGRFRLDDLYDSVRGKEVIVQAKGFTPQRFKAEPGSADRPVRVSIAMEPGHQLKGRVVDDRERPLEGVRVYFAGANHAQEGGGQTTTDVQGRFAFDSLPPDCPFAFYKDGFSEIDNRRLPLDTGEEVTVSMLPAGVIRGRVVDGKTGRPIRRFNVQVTHSPRRRPEDPSAGLRLDLSTPGQVFQSDEGRFQVGDLVMGMPLQAMVSADGYERGVVERIEVARPDEAKAEEFRLDPLDAANLRTYRGRLRDAAGKPVVGVQVRLIAARDRKPDQRADFPFNWSMIRSGQLAQQPNIVRFLESTTDARGTFQFAGIPRGTEVEVAFWGKGIAPGRADRLEQLAEDKEGWFDITLPAPARVAGRIDRKTYVTAARLQISGPRGIFDYEDIELKPDQSDFAFEDLPPGDYTVRLMTAFEPDPGRPGGLTNRTLATIQVTVEAGETGQADF